MKETSLHLQIYFELALSIGNSLNLSTMLKQSLSAYLRKLNGSGGVVLQTMPAGDRFTLRTVHAIPRRLHQNTVIQQVLAHIPLSGHHDELCRMVSRLPAHNISTEGRHCHTMDLPGFGLLVLVRGKEALPITVLKSLQPINRKLADACLACIRNEQVELLKEKAVKSAVALKKANKEMRKLHRAIEQSPSVVVITDLTGCIEYVNPMFTRTSGYTSEEAVGRNPRMLKSGRQDAALYKTLWETISSGKVWEGELLNKAKDGRLFWEQVFISPVKDSDGRITHFIAIKEDISWRKSAEAQMAKAQQEIEEANAARSQFLANMSHEIRTPLNGVIGMTSLLLDTGLDDDQQEMADSIRISADSLMAAVNNILDYAKLMAGQLNLEAAPFELDTMLEDVVSIMEPQIGDKPIRIYQKIAAGVPLGLHGDVGRLKQVMINLVSNAIKFTEGGEVVIRTANTDDDEKASFLHFTISDTGIGIDSDFQSKIFDSFSQHDTSMNRRYGGTGMGLAISRALVRAMGGNIGFSTQPGRGSIFWFTVKLEKGKNCRCHQLSRNPALLAKQDLQPDRSRQRILVVEDNLINQKLTLKILKKLGYAAEAVSNGREAVEAVSRTFYQLVLMDIQMPEMDGLAATRAIRHAKDSRGGQPLPIVALTAHAMLGDRQACFEAGMDDYLSKPVDPQQLAATIIHHIDQSLS